MPNEYPKCDDCDKPAIVNYATVQMKWYVEDGQYIQPGTMGDTDNSEHYCEDHDI